MIYAIMEFVFYDWLPVAWYKTFGFLWEKDLNLSSRIVNNGRCVTKKFSKASHLSIIRIKLLSGKFRTQVDIHYKTTSMHLPWSHHKPFGRREIQIMCTTSKLCNQHCLLTIKQGRPNTRCRLPLGVGKHHVCIDISQHQKWNILPHLLLDHCKTSPKLVVGY